MKTLFLHVGPHKTGTTAIQKFMLDNQSNFVQQGLLYPKRFMSIFGHHPFREKIATRTILDDDLTFFNEANCNLLLSSEDFISLNKSDFEYVKQRFEGFTVNIIFSWRRASNKMYSIWQEVIKHGGTIGFFEYYHEHLARPGMSQMLSADLKLNMFTQVFGAENITVIDYEASAKKKQLTKDFCKSVNIAWQDNFIQSHNVDAVNSSMAITDTEIVRALNFWNIDNGGEANSDVRANFIKHKKQLDKNTLSLLEDIINRHAITLKVGNYFIDVRGERLMKAKYLGNIINYDGSTDIKETKLVRSEWALAGKVNDSINSLGNQLKSLALL